MGAVRPPDGRTDERIDGKREIYGLTFKGDFFKHSREWGKKRPKQCYVLLRDHT